MKRFFGKKQNNQIILEDGEFNHLKKVLRMQEGDEVIANIDDVYDYYCRIQKINKNDCILEIIDQKVCPALPKRNITLFQMLPKREYFDNIIPKSIELGVSKIVPFTSTYTMIKELKKERIATQVMTACKQCERSKLIDVTSPVKFGQLPALLKEYDLAIFAYEKATEPFNPDILKDKQNIAIIIGNEAGFTPDEAQALKTCSAQISLGTRILRCDTAVVATLALISILSNN